MILAKCRHADPAQRISAGRLYNDSKYQMEKFRALAYEERNVAIRSSKPFACYRSKVLYAAEERNQYETNPHFQKYYSEVNLRPLFNIAEDARRAEPAPLAAQPMDYGMRGIQGRERDAMNVPGLVEHLRSIRSIRSWKKAQSIRAQRSREFKIAKKRSNANNKKVSRGAVSAVRQLLGTWRIFR